MIGCRGVELGWAVITGAGGAVLFFRQKTLWLAVLKVTGMVCTLIAADVVVLLSSL